MLAVFVTALLIVSAPIIGAEAAHDEEIERDADTVVESVHDKEIGVDGEDHMELIDDIDRCREMPMIDNACVNALNCAWVSKDRLRCNDFPPAKYGFTYRQFGLDLSDPADIKDYAKDYVKCSSRPPRLIYEPIDAQGRIWLFADYLYICDAERGESFFASDGKIAYLERWGQPDCKSTRIPVADIVKVKSSRPPATSSQESSIREFCYRVKLWLKEGAEFPTTKPNGRKGGETENFAYLEKTRNSRSWFGLRAKKEVKTIYIGCNLLRDPVMEAMGPRVEKNTTKNWWDKSSPSFKLCKNQANRLSGGIRAAMHKLKGKKDNDAKWLQVADMIETVGDEVRGLAMTTAGSYTNGNLDATKFTQGAFVAPTIGQGGQIGGSFEARDSTKSKLFAATLACAGGAAMTIATMGAAAPIGLSVASSCVMLLARGIKSVIEFFVGKKLYLADPPEYEQELKWTEQYVEEINKMAEAKGHDFAAITVETLRQIMCAMSAMKSHMKKVSAASKDEIASIKEIEFQASKALAKLRQNLNQVVNVEELKILMQPYMQKENVRVDGPGF